MYSFWRLQCLQIGTSLNFAIFLQYIAEKNLLTEKPRDVNQYEPLTRILVSVDATVVDKFMEEISAIPLTAVKKHA